MCARIYTMNEWFIVCCKVLDCAFKEIFNDVIVMFYIHFCFRSMKSIDYTVEVLDRTCKLTN